jgi:hypothetical protein
MDFFKSLSIIPSFFTFLINELVPTHKTHIIFLTEVEQGRYVENIR